MNWLEWTGLISIGVLSLIPLYVVYHILRGIVLAFDFTVWRVKTSGVKVTLGKTDNDKRTVSIGLFVRAWASEIIEMIGYNSENIKYHGNNGTTWRGFLTGRK